MSEKKIVKPVALAVGAALAGSFAIAGAVNAAETAESPFKMSSLEVGYMLGEHEGSCGEGSCGEGHDKDKEGEGACGEGHDKDKEGEGACGEKEGEGACGEGSCGGDKDEGEGSCGGSA